MPLVSVGSHESTCCQRILGISPKHPLHDW